MSIIKDNIEKALSVSKKRLEELEKECKTAVVEQYKDLLEKDIKVEKVNIEVLEEKLNELNRKEVEMIKEGLERGKEHKRQSSGKILYHCNNFEATLIQLLLILHAENTFILQYVNTDKTYDTNKMIKIFEDEIMDVLNGIGIGLMRCENDRK